MAANKLWGCALTTSMAILTGCAGKVDYIRPSTPVATNNSKIVNKSKDEVWNTAVPALGKQFFVINNLDKASGLINVSYSGDPEKYVDCGSVSSYVKNARGERTYTFPAASKAQTYEIMTQGMLFFVSRKMELEGRVNLIFEDAGDNKTKVTANTRYLVKRSSTVTQNGGPTGQNSDSISFNSGSSGAFPAANDGRATECVSTGALEAHILGTVQ